MDTKSNILASFGVELDGLQDWEKFEISLNESHNAICLTFIATPEGLPPVHMQRMVPFQELNAIKEEVLPMALLTMIKETRDSFRELVNSYMGDDNDDEN